MQNATLNTPTVTIARTAPSKIRELAIQFGLDNKVAEKAFEIWAKASERIKMSDKILIGVSLYLATRIILAEKMLEEDPEIFTRGLTIQDFDRFKELPSKSKIEEALHFSGLHFRNALNVVSANINLSPKIMKMLEYDRICYSPMSRYTHMDHWKLRRREMEKPPYC